MNLLEVRQKGGKIASTSLIVIAITGGLLASVLAGLAAAAYGYEIAFKNKMFPGVSVAGVKLDGLTRDKAEGVLQQRINQILDNGFNFRIGSDTIHLPRTTESLDDPDLSQDLVTYDVAKAVDQAYQAGRSGTSVQNAFERIRLYMQSRPIDLPTSVNRHLAESLLSGQVASHLSAVRDADLKIKISTSTAEGFVTEITPEQVGLAVDLAPALDAMEAQAKRLEIQPISLRTIRIEPTLTAAELQGLSKDVPAWLSYAPFVVTTDQKKMTVTSSTIAEWLSASSSNNGSVFLALNPETIEKTMATFTADYLKEPRDGKLVLNDDGSFKEFVAPVEGRRVDGEKTIQDMLAAWAHGSSSSPISFSLIVPKITGEDAERLGIQELLGVGQSFFSGSPSNRRRNIALGAKHMNGVLIAPGETFSQLGALGPVDGPHGWLQELVIKDNKTTPEYGGGLCQVGTTSFRMALASGLPIVERRNHSYRVRYYEPAGTDATIYDPAPDFRFKNDTSSTILVTSEMSGDMLAFYAWGTKDGRVAEQTTPRLYNITPPPPAKTILTTDLPVGKKKCTEVAHAGGTASFDYTVTYASGDVKKENFTSFYRPWGAVCLVGATAEEVAAQATQITEPLTP